MNETEFNRLVDAILLEIEEVVEASGAEAECEINAGILEIGFDSGSRIIINRQTPAREIWVAAKSGGYHFGYRAGCWYDTRGGRELFALLGILVGEQTGKAVHFERRF